MRRMKGAEEWLFTLMTRESCARICSLADFICALKSAFLKLEVLCFRSLLRIELFQSLLAITSRKSKKAILNTIATLCQEIKNSLNAFIVTNHRKCRYCQMKCWLHKLKWMKLESSQKIKVEENQFLRLCKTNKFLHKFSISFLHNLK